MAGTRNTKQRAVRQEALREQLSNQKHLEHVIDLINKISDEKEHIDSEILSRYKIAIDARFKIINKYLADLKTQEIDMTHNIDDELKELLDAASDE